MGFIEFVIVVSIVIITTAFVRLALYLYHFWIYDPDTSTSRSRTPRVQLSRDYWASYPPAVITEGRNVPTARIHQSTVLMVSQRPSAITQVDLPIVQEVTLPLESDSQDDRIHQERSNNTKRGSVVSIHGRTTPVNALRQCPPSAPPYEEAEDPPPPYEEACPLVDSHSPEKN